MEITIYEKPTCTKCRQLNKLLSEAGYDFNKVNYYVEPLSFEKLSELIKKMNIEAKELFRTKEETYKELDLKNKEITDEEAIELMVKYPDLMQRPIIEKGDQAILARPPELAKEIL